MNTELPGASPVDKPVGRIVPERDTLGDPPHLEACPFCGSPPEVVWRKSNPRASCKTPGCWSGKGIAIALDDPQQVAAWNCRVPPNVEANRPDTAEQE